MSKFTDEEKEYILSKVIDIPWRAIPDSLKIFWINWRNNN